MFKKFLCAIAVSLSVSFVHAEIAPIKSEAAKQFKVERNEVFEFFSFGCPHCFEFEPQLNEWKKSHPDIKVNKIPVGFNRAWLPLQKLYLTLQILNVPDSAYQKVFDAVHVKHENLFTDNDVVAWAAKEGFDSKFSETYKSFTVYNKAKAADMLVSSLNIEGVPSIVANNGKEIVLISIGKGGYKEILNDLSTVTKK